MKCTNNYRKILSLITAAGIFAALLTGCSGKEYAFAYDRSRNNSSFLAAAPHSAQNTAEPFASKLCVVVNDVAEGTDVDMSQATSAGLFDLDSQRTVYAKNVHEKLNPASLTKTLTALCALEYGKLDDVMTASENVVIKETGAVKIGLKAGDTMTMEQALHALLLKSANDVAVMIAEHISGSVEGFSALMNETAKRIGATNSHFVNPHGLTAEDHYTTAYDLYLIFNEVVKYDKFVEIIHKSSYNVIYRDKNGKEKTAELSTTNAYIKGEAFAPNNVSVIGGKTGTTNAAGYCLVIYSKDSAGKPYISVVMQSEDRTLLYTQMTDLLGEI